MYPYVLSRGKRIVALTALLAAILLLAVSAPLYGQEQPQPPAISPEQAVAIATMQEIGRDDFRISDAGDEEKYPAYWSNVAFNPDDNEYLVVWSGADGSGAQTAFEFEIYAQRVDAATGQEIGPNDVRISAMGPDNNAIYGAHAPSIAYNTKDKQFLVVWSGNDNREGLAQSEREIFGRLLDRQGTPLGDDDLRLTTLGVDGVVEDAALKPEVTYNAVDNRYLVVFSGSLAARQNIYGQFVNADGDTRGASEFLISNMGSDNGEQGLAFEPAVAHNPQTNEYLVVWTGAGTVPNPEFEIYGQLLTATGAPTGADNFRISTMGPDGDPDFAASGPAVAYNATDNQYLVVWAGNDDGTMGEDGALQVYGQLLEADGQPSGADDFAISHLGPDDQAALAAYSPRVAHDASNNRFLVVWKAEVALPENHEVFGRLLDAAGAATGAGALRISQFGPDDSEAFDAFAPAVALDSLSGNYLVVWHGNDDRPGLAPREVEIFGQLVDAGGVETGDDDVLLSDMGHDSTIAVFEPQVAYNAQDHEYLVVWYADRNAADGDPEWEIFGQRVDAATGREVGPNDFRISEIGPDGDGNYDAGYPDVAYNSARNEYLVVWEADNNVNGQVDDEREIYGRTVDAAGTPAPTQLRISYMGPNGNTRYDGSRPNVVYNPIDDRYLVTWVGNDYLAQPGGDPSSAPIEKEIYGRVLPGAINVTFPMVRISHMGPDGDAGYNAFRPQAVHNGAMNQFLVVWYANDSADGLHPDEKEVYGQLLDRDGQTLAESHFRISEAGPDGGYLIHATNPDVAYNPVSNEYLVVWQANDARASLPLGKTEIFGQLLDAYGDQIGASDFQISTTGAMDSNQEYALNPAVTYKSLNDQYVVAWKVLQSYGDALPIESEIEVQLLASDGAQVLANALRLSHMGPDGNKDYHSYPPAVSCATSELSCLIVWAGTDDRGTLTKDEREVFGQLLGKSEPPVALPDVFSTPQDRPLVVPAPGILANDIAPGTDPLTAVLDGEPANGNLALEPNGAFTYTPDAGFTGTDAFTYHASDGVELSEPVSVTITITSGAAEPDAYVIYLPMANR